MRRSLVNLMFSGWAVLGLVGISAATAGEPLRVAPAVQTVTAGQATSNVELAGWRHRRWGGYYGGGGFYGGGWGPRFYGYSGYRPFGYSAYYSSYYQPYGAFYRPYPVAVYSGPVYSSSFYGGPYYGAYSAPAYYSAYGYPAYGWAPAYSVSYRPYWGGGYYGFGGGYYW